MLLVSAMARGHVTNVVNPRGGTARVVAGRYFQSLCFRPFFFSGADRSGATLMHPYLFISVLVC